MVFVQISGAVFFAACIAYLLLAIVGAYRFRERRLSPARLPSVTVLLPCHGVPARLYDCLRSVCDHDYGGPVQVVFGLHAADDPARAVIDRVIADLPGLDAAVVVNDRRVGAHPKNCNLANMMAAARHDVLVQVDSDVLVPKGFLPTIVASLEGDNVGAATCMYKGAAQPGFASRLGTSYINDWFVPSAMVDLTIHDLGTTYGAAAAFTRQTLAAIGGFEAMAATVSSDFALGREVRRLGLRIALAPLVVATVVDESGIANLYHHELRWMRAIRTCRPMDHALWICSSGLVPLALLALAWPAAWGGGAVAAYLTLRLVLHLLIRRRIQLGPAEPHLLPLREVANFALWIGSLLIRRVQWGSQVMVVGRDNSVSTESR
jgi:ceramide glucosyltransferase